MIDLHVGHRVAVFSIRFPHIEHTKYCAAMPPATKSRTPRIVPIGNQKRSRTPIPCTMHPVPENSARRFRVAIG